MTPRHPFFLKSRKEQRRFQARLVLASLLLICSIGALFYLAGLLPLIFLALAVVLSIIAPFLDVPSMVRAGKLRYYSPFLLGEAERNSTVVLHAGTLFDFYFLFSKDMSARDRKRRVLTGMIDGLIHLIEQHEDSGGGTLRIRTTSYILNERNARRLGLEKQPADALQMIILYYNYFNLTASYSLLNRRLRFPRLKSIQTFEGCMANLIEKKPYLEKLGERLRQEMEV